jgi:AAA family ATP:ADP antiporter
MRRVAELCLFAFLVLASYALARPPIESTFLAEHGSRSLPAVWLAVAVAVVPAAALVRRTVARTSLRRAFVAAALVSGALLAALLLARSMRVPGASFALYVWKDVYVVVLIELFWSIVNVSTPFAEARWTYGLFCVAGSLGGAAGNLGTGVVAVRIGSAAAPWLVLPCLLAACLACLTVTTPRRAPSPSAGRGSEVDDPGAAAAPAPGELAERAAAASAGPRSTLELLRGERRLALLLALVALAQLTITLVDYRFNAVVESALPDVDARTVAIGRVYAATDGAALVLQLLSGPLLRLVGLPAVLLGVPVVVAAAALALAGAPGLLVASVCKVTAKALDYSLSRVAKELCYLPLGYADKTQGKAVVDVLGYRVSKAGASLLLAGMAVVAVQGAVAAVAVASALAWSVVAMALGRAQRRGGDDPRANLRQS